MQVAVETLNNLERKMTVSVPSENIDTHIKKRTQELMKTAKLDGFRVGKIPEHVIKQRFGASIEYEAINDAVNHSLQDALKTQNLFPAGSPHLHFDEKYESGKSFTYTATFEVFPEIPVKPFSDLIIEKVTADITEEDLVKTLEGMRKQQTHFHETARAAKEGDRVSIKFEGTVDGVPFEGGKSDNMPVIIGSKSTIPGFEEGIIGATVGQDITVDVTFPENYGAKNLAGKPAKFAIHINKIEEPHMPELDDKFAEKFGITDGGINKLREEVKETLQKQLSHALRHKLKSEVMAKLAEMYKEVEVPKALIQRESENLLNQMKKQFEQFQSPNSPNFTPDMFADRAKERVVLGLVVNEIIKRGKLKAEASKVRQLIEEIAERFDDADKVVKYYYQDKQRLAEVESLALEEQIVDKVVSEATLVEKPGKAAELLSIQGG